jgi:hypothetical protein
MIQSHHTWRRSVLAAVLAIWRLLSGVGAYAAKTYSIVNIADTDTPGPTGLLTSFGFPAISGAQVSFFAGYSGGNVASGVFVVGGGPLTTIVKRGDLAPGSSSSFHTFGFDATISDGIVAFWGDYTTPGSRALGFYTGNGGLVSPVIEEGDPAPGGTFTRLAFSQTPAIDGDALAFRGETSGNSTGIFRSTAGVLTTIAKQGDPAPGGGTFRTGPLWCSEPSLSGDNVAFQGLFGPGAQSGVFVGNGGPLTTIAKTGDAAPLGTFTSFVVPVISGDNVAFRGVYGDSGQGIFVGSGGPLTTIAKTGDDAPSGVFESFGTLAVSGDEVAFTANYDGGKTGVFAAQGGVVDAVLKPGDPLFGSAVQRATVGRFGLDPEGSGRLAIFYHLDDGRAGVAMATPIPEPMAGIVALVGGVGGMAIRRRTGAHG